MATHYARLATPPRPRRLYAVAGRPVTADFAAHDRRTFIDREERKPDPADLIHRYDWRAWLRDMRDAAITILLFGIALGAGDLVLELLQ